MSLSRIPIGIDLGTTFSAIAFLDKEGRPGTITNREGELTTPTVVFFDHDGTVVGSEAVLAGEAEPHRLAKLAKRDMGSSRHHRPILNRHFPPEVIQSLVLRQLKEDAEVRIGKFEKAVVTVPAYFNEPRRKATQDAGQLAGLDVIDIINEPTAAALAYGIQKGFLNEQGQAASRELVLVYDLGGGTFDVTLMEIDQSNFNTIATAGDVYLGGVDWDQRILDYAAGRILDEYGLECSANPILHERLQQQCTRAKKNLTARTETLIRLEHEGRRISVDLTQGLFENLTQDLLERTRLTTDRLLRDSGTAWNELTNLILVGGSTRMPMVQRMLTDVSGLEVDRSLSPDESIAHGAAIYAGILMNHGPSAGSGISVQNVNSHDLGVLGVDPATRQPKRQVVIRRNQRLPAMQSRKFVTATGNQKRIVVKVVEGGTDSGEGATHIGRCVVDQLPENLVKGTPVMVSFQYLPSGRLEVLATIPTLNITTASTIDRAEGMTKSELAKWQREIEQGLHLSKGLSGKADVVTADAPDSSPPDIRTSKTKPAAFPTSSEGTAPVRAPSAPVSTPPTPRTPETESETNPADQVPVINVGIKKDETPPDPAQFGFGRDHSRPLVSQSSVELLSLSQSETEPPDLDLPVAKRQESGDSVLDFLSQQEQPTKPGDSDSALGEFLSDLDK